MADEEEQIANRRNQALSLNNSGKYSLNTLCYPSDVSNISDLSHYVTFFINVRQSSQAPGNRLGFVNNENQNRTQTTTTAAAVIGAGIAGGAAGYAITDKIINFAPKANTSKKVSRAQRDLISMKKTAGAAIGAAVVGGVAAATFNIERTQRLSDAITIAVQSSPTVKYGVTWETGELGTVLGQSAGGTSTTDASSNAMNIASDMARRVAEVAASAPTQLAGSAQMQTFIESSTKKVINPQKEQLFKGVDFRTFTFNYKFMPKSVAEKENVQRIINTFKYHMHPELSPSGIYYIYPSEFDIQYYYRGKENENINKISSCALTSMSVDYGGPEFSTFSDGSPTIYNLTLTFVELETMTKERINKGY